MPNWVFNTLTIQGPKKQIDYIKYRLNEPFTKMHDSWNMETQELESVEYTFDNPVFAFWNIIRPTDLETYALQKDPKSQSDALNGKILFDGDNWYDWNVRNWGTKWDVAVSWDEEYPETELMEESETSLAYRFNTAWSPPEPAIAKLSEQYPNCSFTLSFEEETGWGGEYLFENGSSSEIESYGWKCRECNHIEDETPYCETCEFDMCPECGYGEPMDEDRAKCEEHNELTTVN